MTGRAFLALFLAACAQGSVDAATLGTEPAPPKSSSPSSSPSPSKDADVPDAEPDDGGEITPVDAAVPEASVEASVEASAEAGVDAGPPPTIDGTIAPGEYGSHVDGVNMKASPGAAPTTAWYMTWNDAQLFVGVSAANVAEGLVLYVDVDPAGTAGSLVGAPYDNTKIASLPFHADFVAYVKSTYDEVRTATGAGAWSAAVIGAITVSGTGSTREIAIPWTAIRAAGRPSSFAWTGYVTSSGGYVYGAMPITNPGGFVGTNASFGSFYRIDDATPGSGTKPFAIVAP